MSTEVPILRADYRPPAYLVETTDLIFELHDDHADVRSRLVIVRNPNGCGGPLHLDGDELETVSFEIDGAPVDRSRITQTPTSLTIEEVPDRFVFEAHVRIRPQDNTKLMGLYQSGGLFCSQCEAEGFRRITWSIDRPDVLSRYTTFIEADRRKFPVLLSNGDRIEAGQNGERHWVRWRDPYPKPSYLFALVAGDLACQRGEFVTRSGRKVALEIWVEPANIARTEHALQSLTRSMAWDEEAFGLEYDLDTYMIVAVNDFNMGAMENKGLNVFNSKFVLALPDTATDAEYESIEAVIAHEYFHNWTGNRVTCRDWFQLTLKEGLTVFRDQLYTADQTSAAVKRIDDVRYLRSAQFAEDSGPMAHPIRPESYIEMNNFYTLTVYEKGAEVVRMYQTILGKEGFRRGMDLYFERHDGTAVTCDDFRKAMGDANGRDFSQFERWYSTAGTPTLHAEGQWNPEASTYTLTLRQSHPAPDFEPLHIPVAVGLIGEDGRELPLHYLGQQAPERGTTTVIELKQREQTFAFQRVDRRPVASLLRGLSAPVRLDFPRTSSELAHQLANDRDPFNRWDAGQVLAEQHLLELLDAYEANRRLEANPALIEAFGRVLADDALDGATKSLMLSLPDEHYLSQLRTPVPVVAIHEVRRFLLTALATAHADTLERVYVACAPNGEHSKDRASVDRRRLRNTTLALLALAEPESGARRAQVQFRDAANMTERQGALAVLCELPGVERDEALAAFYARYENDPLVIDKWFMLQARSSLPDTLSRVLNLERHPAFSLKNPNRARALVGSFCSGNLRRFHEEDGRGYEFLADIVLKTDAQNPQLAARFVSAFNSWRRFDAERAALMRTALERIAGKPDLSRDVSEIVGRALSQ